MVDNMSHTPGSADLLTYNRDPLTPPLSQYELGQKICLDMGFDHFAVCHVGRSSMDCKQAGANCFVTNFPAAWVEKYKLEKMFHSDPILAFAPRTTRATPWADLGNLGALTPDNRKVLATAAENGIRSGLFMSARNFAGDMQIVSFSNTRLREFSAQERHSATLMGLALADAAAETGNTQPQGKEAEFTARELECLTWVAIGKSSHDTAMILGISNNTVDFHVKNAMAKLEASTRTLAVVKALRMGLINP